MLRYKQVINPTNGKIPDMKKETKCPGCGTWEVVTDQLNWNALSCPGCKTFYQLAPWLLTSKLTDQDLNK